MNKTLKTVLSFVLAISIILALCGVCKYVTDKAHEETDRDIAVRSLSWLKGRIDEIEVLSYHLEIPDEVLQEQLDDIVNYQNFERANDRNPYIADFKFVTPDSSSVGELCSILRSQINNYIHIIEYG